METKKEKILLTLVVSLTAFILIGLTLRRHFQAAQIGAADLVFAGSGQLEEASKMSKSKNTDWWLNSGGQMDLGQGEAQTNLGALPENDNWRKLYAKNNSRDTDGGYYPQNIFRLVTRNKWQNYDQQVYFKVDKINLSGSDYRNESNGVLLFNRYADGDNLYYTGLRVDGDAVIKKKIKGTYYTLAEKKVFSNHRKYDRTDNPNVLPLNQWVGIRSVVTNSHQAVQIKLYADLDGQGKWQLLLETKDEGNFHKTAPLLEAGHAGLRTDFMDVHFKDYRLAETE